MDTPQYDIAINGAGPVGCTLALMLAAKASDPKRIVVIGKQIIPSSRPVGPDKTVDPRTLALNHGSRVLLESLGGWPNDSASINMVHVSQRGRLGRTVIDYRELGVPRLGSVVTYDGLLSKLQAAMATCGVDIINAPAAATLAPGRLEINLGERQLSSAVVVQSDGAKPQGIRREYRQHAILVTVSASLPKQGWAFERFTDQGPLAVLPHPDAPDLYGIVWCCSSEKAKRLHDLDVAHFQSALNVTFGDRLGRLTCVGPRHMFALSMHAGPSLINRRTVAIGNAAQTLHPVAGQGLNLGLRDAAQLAHALSPWLCQPGADPGASLAAFAQNRRPDRWLTAAITDVLPRVFATRNPVVRHACGLGLLSLDLAAPVRSSIARQLLQGLRT